MACIYALTDPRNNDEVRYVGQTTQRADVRRKQHVRAARSSRARHSHTLSWIRSVLDTGLEPGCRILEECNEGPQVLAALEVQWIAQLRALGARLTNACVGGNYMPPAVEAATTERRRLGQLRRWNGPDGAAQRAAQRAHFKGKKQKPEDVVRRLAAIEASGGPGSKGYKWSPETLAKMSASHRGQKPSPRVAHVRRMKKVVADWV